MWVRDFLCQQHRAAPFMNEFTVGSDLGIWRPLLEKPGFSVVGDDIGTGGSWALWGTILWVCTCWLVEFWGRRA